MTMGADVDRRTPIFVRKAARTNLETKASLCVFRGNIDFLILSTRVPAPRTVQTRALTQIELNKLHSPAGCT